MKIGLKLRETPETIEHKMLFALVPEVDKLMASIIPNVQKRMRNALIARINQCPEIVAMTSGPLFSELGMNDIRQRLDSIIAVWANGLTVQRLPTRVTNRKLVGGLRIMAIRSDYHDVLNLAVSEFVTPERSFILPWLSWLLVEGRKVVVKQYNIAVNRKNSRTGLYVMRKNKVNSYKIPSEYSGTSANNFVTRALSTFDTVFEVILESELEKAA